MRLSQRLLALLAPVVLVAACASGPSNQSIPIAARDKIGSTDVVVPMRQNEIYAFVPTTQAGVYNMGLVGALVGAMVVSAIDAANATAAENDMKPLRNALVDFSFDEMFKTQLQDSLTQAAWLNPAPPRIVKEVTNDKLDGVYTASTAAGVLMINTDYQLNANADELLISSGVMFFPKTPELSSQLRKPSSTGVKTQVGNALYSNGFSFRARVPGATTNRDANVVIWSANNGQAARDLLKLGAAKIAEMMVADLNADPAAIPDTKKLPKMNSGLLQGYQLRTDAEGSVVYLPSGAQSYVHNSMSVTLVAGVQPPETVDPNAPPAPKKMSARERAAAEKAAEKERRAKAKAEKQGQ